MANPEHVEIVRQGTESIAIWRANHPKGQLDLSGANLHRAELNGSDLHGANLRAVDLTWSVGYRVDFRGANLERAKLGNAVMNYCDFNNADLWRANLREGTFCSSDFSDARMSEAVLGRANLLGSYLEHTDLQGANLVLATLGARTDPYDTEVHNSSGGRIVTALVDRWWVDRYFKGSGAASAMGANLTGADLCGASLRGVSLAGANLTNANLTLADLSRSRLADANVSGSDLTSADLNSADLNGMNISGAKCAYTLFLNVDLSSVRGLASTHHVSPSTIGADTLYNSRGKISAAFLRGCGLKDWEIEDANLYDRNLSANQIVDVQQRVFDLRAGSPIQIGSLFISYTHADSAFVDALEEKLNARGIRFWRDIHHATAGRLDRIVDRAMRLNPTVLLVLSKHSITSDWVEDEVDRARELEKELRRDVLCPIALDDAWKDCAWSRPLRTQIKKYNVLTFNNWQDPEALQEMFSRLVKGLSIFYQPGEPDR